MRLSSGVKRKSKRCAFGERPAPSSRIGCEGGKACGGNWSTDECSEGEVIASSKNSQRNTDELRSEGVLAFLGTSLKRQLEGEAAQGSALAC